jgi:hypothetical protein
MRALAIAALLTACGSSASDNKCKVDGDCGGDVCARNGECAAASLVRMVKVTWTVRGQQASATTCGSTPSLELWFNSAQDYFGYEPVPCMEGQFTIDKIPTRYDEVELDVLGGNPVAYSPIPASATVAFDLNL